MADYVHVYFLSFILRPMHSIVRQIAGGISVNVCVWKCHILHSDTPFLFCSCSFYRTLER